MSCFSQRANSIGSADQKVVVLPPFFDSLGSRRYDVSVFFVFVFFSISMAWHRDASVGFLVFG